MGFIGLFKRGGCRYCYKKVRDLMERISNIVRLGIIIFGIGFGVL